MKPRFVTFHYTVRDTEGNVLDTSSTGAPMMYLEGANQVFPALEQEMKKMRTGAKAKIPVHQSDAYGNRDERLVMRVPLEKLPGNRQIRIGQKFSLKTKEMGEQIFRVIELTPGDALLDANHPFAGKDLVFDVEVVDVRQAFQENMAPTRSIPTAKKQLVN